MIEQPAPKVAILNYGMSNLFSVKNTCEKIDLKCEITSDKSMIIDSDAIIMPGVGAFGNAMDNLKKLDLILPIKDFIASGKPFLGICLGMQLLMSESEEFGTTKGLDIIKGKVIKFPILNRNMERVKNPHIGWNKIYFTGQGNAHESILKNIDNGEYMYFVHSYFVNTFRKENTITTTEYYGIEFCSGLKKGNILGFQFHPEKSGKCGLEIIRNFKEIINSGGLNG